ncbi:SDR family NAD(P)-dependent oxidoreductase [Vogesella indigofera]|uniref:SDR family NAD(P)-dependent oxidoreductase n=1 Tax=Vogesella indigofera TaxID=45465 RepID=UPI00234F2842|nr:SDR family NAD(P)-dependent oxidoreductase [Vogesella indigofera]MDC7698200.1 SDR family NAD(P)-dependent oxidoreductase [Vogesella indigofera]
MNGYVVTGASRGLGAALTAQLLRDGGRVVAVARDCSALPEHPQLITLDADLADSSLLPLLLERALAALGDCDSLTLINNAGTVQPIAQVGAYPPGAAEQAIALNLTAPLLLCDAFVAHSAGHGGVRRVLNISSGAAANPYPGWSVYCASKAGVDHFTRTLAAEQQGAAKPLLAVSLYPGVIDTSMQGEIRAADPAQFPHKPRFDALKADGQLTSPAAAAAAIVTYLHSAAFGSVPVLDIRQL